MKRTKFNSAYECGIRDAIELVFEALSERGVVVGDIVEANVTKRVLVELGVGGSQINRSSRGN